MDAPIIWAVLALLANAISAARTILDIEFLR
jgi:hypothetical protein